jgi:hypothetical protein
MKKMMMAMGLLVLASFGTGCDTEPEGSCTTTEINSGDHGVSSSQVCRKDSTASACAAVGGTFDEGDDCFLFTIIRLPAAGAGD